MVERHWNPGIDEKVARLQGGLDDLVQTILDGIENALSPFGIDAVGYTVFRTCHAAGQISAGDLRKLVPVDPGQMSRTTSRLEDKGMIRKTRLENDRRRVTLRVTDKGHALMREFAIVTGRFYDHLTRDVGHEELIRSFLVMEKMIARDPAGEEETAVATHLPVPSFPGKSHTRTIEWCLANFEGVVTTLASSMRRAVEERTLSYKLSVMEYSVLATCFAAKSITIPEIANYAPVGVGRISQIVSKLQDRELIRKVRRRGDRRVVTVEMTNEGQDLAHQIVESLAVHYAYIFEKVSDKELTNLILFVEKLAADPEGAARR